MREIKFRIWDTEDKRWTVYEDVAWLQMVGLNKLKLKTKKGIVCEYTGLKDKNGKEIYEGDIVKVDISAFGERVGVIEFFEEEFCVKVNKGYYTGGMRYDFPEVIGNIYENSELLKCDK